MKIVDFGRVWGASGVQGFFGEGYWFHHWLKPVGLDFSSATFVAKTTTLGPRLDPSQGLGNMPLKEDWTPSEIFPKCIVVRPLQGLALNAVGLSGPGAKALFETGRWQSLRKPFFLSFMSVASTPQHRIEELREFVTMLKFFMSHFNSRFGLQINYSCPNVGLHTKELVDEVEEGLGIAYSLAVPIIPKFNVMLSVEAAARISKRQVCDGICVSNTIPWGQLKDAGIDSQEIFGTNVSPLEHLKGGGLSGRPLLPLLLRWIKDARKAGVKTHLNGGGGILSLRDAYSVLDAGADSVSLGSIAFLRPWRVRKIVEQINT